MGFNSGFKGLKRSEGRGKNEYPIKLKRRKNKCIGQILRRIGFLHIIQKKKGRDEKTRRKK
jgi:hypothetical protein